MFHLPTGPRRVDYSYSINGHADVTWEGQDVTWKRQHVTFGFEHVTHNKQGLRFTGSGNGGCSIMERRLQLRAGQINQPWLLD